MSTVSTTSLPLNPGPEPASGCFASLAMTKVLSLRGALVSGDEAISYFEHTSADLRGWVPAATVALVSETESANRRRVLGIDLGARRVGLAISDASGTLARPLSTLQAGASAVETVARLTAAIEPLLADDDGLVAIVVGLPRRLDGSPNDQTEPVRQIAEALRARVPIPIVLQDERLSSREAESRLAVLERDWRRRKVKLDAAAAAVILQDYLDERRSASTDRQG